MGRMKERQTTKALAAALVGGGCTGGGCNRRQLDEGARGGSARRSSAGGRTRGGCTRSCPTTTAERSREGQPAKWPDAGGGAAGYWTTPAAGPVGDDDPAALTIPKLYDRIAHNLFSINVVWTLVTGFLVMFMQAGFASVETGLCRAKNSAHTMAMNMMIYPLGCFAFYVYGFALGWGNWWNGPVPPGWYASLGPGVSILNSGWGVGGDGTSSVFKYGIIGTKGWCLSGVEDVSVLALFFFQMVFFDTTATIPTGAMAERWSWKNFCLYGLWVAVPYCIYANWVWGGGWLAQAGKNWGLGHGAVDFAGSGVVHAMGGVIGLAGAIVIGPRIGKYVDGKIHRHSPATTFRWPSSERLSWRSAGSGLIPAPRSPAPICGSAPSS